MAASRHLDLFGIDLFAASIDAHRSTPEEMYPTISVDRRVVAGDRVSGPADRSKGRFGLARIAKVPLGHRSRNCQNARLVLSGSDRGPCLIIEDDRGWRREELCRLWGYLTGGRDGQCERASL